MKRMMLGAMYQHCIVLFALLILYYAIIANVGIVIVKLELLKLIEVAYDILVVWIWTSFSEKVLVKNKIKYLKEENEYEEYVHASEFV